MATIQHTIPQLFNRFRYSILSYAFVRERIIYNNSLNSFEQDPFDGYNIDAYYQDLSMDNEAELNLLKVEYMSTMEEMVRVL